MESSKTLNLRFVLSIEKDITMSELVHDIQDILYNEIGASGFFKVHPISRNGIEANTFVDVEIYRDQIEDVEHEIQSTLEDWNLYTESSSFAVRYCKLYAINPRDFLRN